MSSKKQVRVRDVLIGGGAPVVIQSMTNADSRDEKGTLEQVARLRDAGCQIVRISVPDREALEVFRSVRQKPDMPLVADIHFDWRMAGRRRPAPTRSGSIPETSEAVTG